MLLYDCFHIKQLFLFACDMHMGVMGKQNKN